MGLLTRNRADGNASAYAPSPGETLDEPPVESRSSSRGQRRKPRKHRGAVGEWTFGTHLKTRAVHGLLVVALVCGPLAAVGLAAQLAGGSDSTVTPAPVTAVIDDPGPAERASAAAQRLVGAWLSASRDDASSLQAQLAQPVDDLDLALPATRPAAPTRLWVDDLAALPNGRWTVTVGALTGAAGTTSYYTVPVQTDAVGAVALALPARAVGPVKAAVADPDEAGPSLSLSDPAALTAAGYLAALTGGAGDIDRWTSPDATLPAIDPAPCSAVKVQQVQTTADPVPAPTNDGAELGVLVTASCSAPASAQGADPLVTVSQYPLLLRARGSRWEVARTNPTLTQPGAQTSTQPSPDPTPTASTR